MKTNKGSGIASRIFNKHIHTFCMAGANYKPWILLFQLYSSEIKHMKMEERLLGYGSQDTKKKYFEKS